MTTKTTIIGTVAAVLMLGACASNDGPTVVDNTRDPVEVRAEQIKRQIDAGREATEKCRGLGLNGDQDCIKDLARTRLGVNKDNELPQYVGR